MKNSHPILVDSPFHCGTFYHFGVSMQMLLGSKATLYVVINYDYHEMMLSYDFEIL